MFVGVKSFTKSQKVKPKFHHLKRLKRFTGLFWSFDAKLHIIGHQTSFIGQSSSRLFFCFLCVVLSFFWVVCVFVPDLTWSKEKLPFVAIYFSVRQRPFSSLCKGIDTNEHHSTQRYNITQPVLKLSSMFSYILKSSADLYLCLCDATFRHFMNIS